MQKSTDKWRKNTTESAPGNTFRAPSNDDPGALPGALTFCSSSTGGRLTGRLYILLECPIISPFEMHTLNVSLGVTYLPIL